MSDYASESGHWYDSDGTPRYTIVGANGNERPTTLRDARKLNLYPSVTTITGCAAAPGLERWKAEQLMHAALTLPQMEGEPEADWVRRVWDDSREQARAAAERGKLIHAAIERHYRGETFAPEMRPWVVAATEAVGHHISRAAEWSPEKPFAHPAGYGGKVDLHSADCDGIVVDFKTKDSDKLADVKLYDSHFMQLAAYGHGLGFENPQCYVVFIGRDKPAALVLPMTRTERERGLAQFTALLAYWQAKAGYRPEA